eukprot:3060659-Prymnesium_polylepis.1
MEEFHPTRTGVDEFGLKRSLGVQRAACRAIRVLAASKVKAAVLVEERTIEYICEAIEHQCAAAGSHPTTARCCSPATPAATLPPHGCGWPHTNVACAAGWRLPSRNPWVTALIPQPLGDGSHPATA